MSTNITTGKVRFSYAHLFQPYAPNGVGEPKYSVSILIDKNDEKTINAVNAAVAEAKEQGKTQKWAGKIPAKLDTPLRDGDENYPNNPEYAGKYYINCKNTRKPGVVDANLNAILDPQEVYSGCYGRVNVSFYPYDASGNKGIAASLQHVQKLADGEPLGGGGVSVETAFGAFEDEDFLD